MSYTLVLEWMPGDLYMSAVTARCTAPTSSYSVVWLPPNKVYQITLYCGSTSLVSFLVGAFRGKAWSYMSDITIYESLANAIILQAVKDYRMALKSLKANSRNRTVQTDKAEIERFFRSQWYSTLTDVNGEMLILSLQKEADKFETNQ